jgi:hypothetical protein
MVQEGHGTSDPIGLQTPTGSASTENNVVATLAQLVEQLIRNQ